MCVWTRRRRRGEWNYEKGRPKGRRRWVESGETKGHICRLRDWVYGRSLLFPFFSPGFEICICHSHAHLLQRSLSPFDCATQQRERPFFGRLRHRRAHKTEIHIRMQIIPGGRLHLVPLSRGGEHKNRSGRLLMAPIMGFYARSRERERNKGLQKSNSSGSLGSKNTRTR